ncbi:MAG: hypothetical protein M1830_004280, partial [Pleopsidium flavum]
REIPDRKLPESAAPVPTTIAAKHSPNLLEEEAGVPLSGNSSLHDHEATPPASEELDFGARNVARSGEDEGVFSPTEF